MFGVRHRGIAHIPQSRYPLHYIGAVRIEHILRRAVKLSKYAPFPFRDIAGKRIIQITAFFSDSVGALLYRVLYMGKRVAVFGSCSGKLTRRLCYFRRYICQFLAHMRNAFVNLRLKRVEHIKRRIREIGIRRLLLVFHFGNSLAEDTIHQLLQFLRALRNPVLHRRKDLSIAARLRS